jgi:transposase
MPGRAAKVIITERQQTLLQQWSHSRTEALYLRQRAHIILLAFAGNDNESIAATVGLERHQVGHWRRCWQKAFDRLVQIECLEPPAALRAALVHVLSDAPRSGSPGKFTAEQLTQLFAVACEPPKDSGRPITHWTPRELADELQKRGIVASISPRQVGRLLNQASLHPHRSRYWLNAPDKDQPHFAQEVQQVCETYAAAVQRYQCANTHTHSTDEKTGIQALERIAPTLEMKPGLEQRREFEYKRNGTLALIVSFHIVTGTIFTATVGPTRTEADFVQHVARVVAQDSKAGHIFVVDQLNTHSSEGLVRLVAKNCGIAEETLGKKGQRGILKTLKSRQVFLKDLSHRIRFVYTPKHTSWLNQVEIWFSVLSRRLLKRGNFTSVADLKQQLLDFIAYFNKTLAKPYRWTFTGRVLQT